MSHRKLNEELSDYEKSPGSPPAIDRAFLSNLFSRHEIDSGDSSRAIKSQGLVPGLVVKLKSDPKNGLDGKNTNDFLERERIYGRNEPITAEQKSLWMLVKYTVKFFFTLKSDQRTF